MNNKYNIELYVLKYLFSKEAYNKYASFIESKFLHDNSPDIHRLYTAIVNWHSKFPDKDISNISEFAVFFRSIFPSVSQKDTDAEEILLNNLSQIEVDETVARDFLIAHIQRAKAMETSLLALEVADGRKDFGALAANLDNLEGILTPDRDASEFVVLADDDGFPPPGLRWPLDCLNKSMGSLRVGDNGFAFARPESGKTTFALHAGTFMAQQLVEKGLGPCIYANNEQPGDVMMERAIQAALGINEETFFKYKRQAIQKFNKLMDGRFLMFDKAAMTSRDVEKLVHKYKPGLLILDQTDNIKGFSDKRERDDLSLKALYQWTREISKECCPVIGLCQAGGTGEGKKWLTMDDVDGSKTAKQSAADWIIGIGKSHQEGMESIRHFHLSKNKLRGDEDTDRSRRHGKMDVRINEALCRFEDI